MFQLIDFLIVRPIANILFVIYGFVGDFGFAIILFTLLVKMIIWPLTKRQYQQTKLMRKLQPELAQIKKNCNGNRQMESLQMMDLYKRYNVKPFRSMLTLIIQLPIFIAIYTAIRVIAVPTPTDNLMIRVYPGISEIGRIKELTEKQETYIDEVSSFQERLNTYNAEKSEYDQLTNEEKNTQEEPVAPEQPVYDFYPKLFGILDLSVRPGFGSIDSFVILIFALLSAGSQLIMSKLTMPSNKSKKSRKFRDLLKDAEAGKDPDQIEMNEIMSKQMSYMMPLMMLMILINLQGALVFYYLLSNILSIAQQQYILRKNEDVMDEIADKKIVKDLKKMEEGQIVKKAGTGNSKTNIYGNEKSSGEHITRISASKSGRKKK